MNHIGVFVRGVIKKGEVVALYPGIYYPPLPLYALGVTDGSCGESANLVRHMWEDNVYCINLPDIGGYIDGDLDNKKSMIESPSPYAVGHKINHPDKFNIPNVSTFEFLWRDAFDCGKGCGGMSFDTFLSFSPNKMGVGPWFVDPTTHEVITIENAPTKPPLPGLALIALENIEDGKELFLDYQLGPKNRPVWYYEPTYRGL